MPKDIKKKVKTVVQRQYLSKDFDQFRRELLEYARTFFPDKIKDFSDASTGGMFLDFAAFVGDSMSFYLDHQFNELNIETAVETTNVESLLRNAGVKIRGASPSVCDVDFYLEVDSEKISGEYYPKAVYLPVVKEGTILNSNTGVKFELTHNIDFSQKHGAAFVHEYITSKTDADGNPSTFLMKATGQCVSGQRFNETFAIPDTTKPFRKIQLKSSNVTDIISVADSESNRYYEVDSLAQDVIYKRVSNTSEDFEDVSENFELLPAPYRFISSTSKKSGLTTIRFGSGRAGTLDDDIVPDPSELAMPLYGKKTFSRFTMDPGSLLETQTLGISPRNTTITVVYRAGGGLSHNVDTGTVNSISALNLRFKENVPSNISASIRASMSVNNENPARGAEDAPTLTELRSIALGFKNSQSRIVTKQDLISRLYTMPTNFGRVFRVGISSNPNNPLATRLHIISRNRHGQLVTSPDTLKRNIRVYINEFRLISDAIDIIDANVINFGINYSIVVDQFSNSEVTLQKINKKLKDYFKIQNFQIGSPIFISDVQNIIINADGVSSLSNLRLSNLFGVIEERQYSPRIFDVPSNIKENILIAPEGSIFEIRHPDEDIVGNAS
jgi:hypothetical protein